MQSEIVLFGGPAGGGKSTLARAWAASRPRGAHIELDDVRRLIVGGHADPQVPGPLQAEQYRVSVSAACLLGRRFAEAGYEVAIDDVLEPYAFELFWLPELEGVAWKVVVVLPTLEETLDRSSAREKRVQAEHVRTQHSRCSTWPESRRLDTTGLSVAESLAALQRMLGTG